MSGSASTSPKRVVEAVAETLRSGSHGAIRSLLSSAATFSTREQHALEKELSQAIRANDPLTVAAIAIVGESFVDASSPTPLPSWFATAFRPTTSTDRAGTRRFLEVVASEAAAALSDRGQSRIQDLINLIRVFERLALEEEKLVARVSRSKDLVYWLLASAEDAFIDYRERGEKMIASGGRSPTPEVTAEAVSFVLNALARSKRTPAKWFRKVHAGPPAELATVLRRARELNHVRSMEPLVSTVGYRCIAEGRNFRIVPPNDDVDCGVTVGGIDLTHALRRPVPEIQEVPSLREAAAELVRLLGTELFEWVREGASQPALRLRLTPTVQALLRQYLYQDERLLFREELHELEVIARESGVDVDRLMAHSLGIGLDVRLFLQAVRPLLVLALSRSQEVRRVRPRSVSAYWTSMMTVIRRDELRLLLVRVVPNLSDDAVDSLLDALTGSVSSGQLDLQYCAFLGLGRPGGERLCQLPTLAAHSLGVRNALYRSKNRPGSDGKDDLLVAEIADACYANHIQPVVDMKYSFSGATGDIDVMFLVGRTLFVLECKRTLWFATTFEMRTVWSAFEKASSQLERFLRLWADPAFRQSIETKSGGVISAERVVDVVPGIVTTSRTMSGYQLGKFPVRHGRQLVHMMNGGASRVGTAQTGILTLYAYLGPVDAEYLLRDFFSSEWRLSRCMKESRMREEGVVPLADINVRSPHVGIAGELLISGMLECFQLVSMQPYREYLADAGYDSDEASSTIPQSPDTVREV